MNAVLIIAVAGLAALAEVQYTNQQLDTMTLPQAKEALRPGNVELHFRIAQAAIRTQRWDLVQACLADTYAPDELQRSLINVPDSAFKDRVALGLLKAPGWPNRKAPACPPNLWTKQTHAPRSRSQS